MRSKGITSGRDALISRSLVGHTHSEITKQKISEAARARDPATRVGGIGWSKGQTKETSQKLAEMGRKTSKTLKARYKNPETPHWIKGRCKDNDDRVKKISASLQLRFKRGMRQWNTGLTKDSDQRIARMSIDRRLSAAEIQSTCDSLGFQFVGGVYTGNANPIEVKCMRCDARQSRSIVSLKSSGGRCSHCDPVCSAWHLEVLNYVRSIAPGAIANDRTLISPLELDILVPDHSFAIECNGLYWHSARVSKSAWDHQLKVDLCIEKSITLLHLFEDEWRDKRAIVESMIAARMGRTKRVGARTLRVAEVPTKDAISFFNENHLDGHTPASITYGLYDRNRLLSAMSLRTPHHRKWAGRVEVARFATLLHHTVPGALSRLTSFASRQPILHGKDGLMSYSDCRLGGKGESYVKSGWAVYGSTSPRFWWTDNNVRYDRFRYRAVDGMPESQVADAAGVSRIYGCKNIILVYDKAEETVR